MKKLIAFFTLVFISSFARAEIVVIVNSNSTEQITTATFASLYLGKIKTFPSGTKAIPIMPDYNATDLSGFLQARLNKDTGQFRAYWSQLIFTGGGIPPQVYKSSQDIIDLVSRNPDVIGIVDSSVVNNTVKVVTFN